MLEILDDEMSKEAANPLVHMAHQAPHMPHQASHVARQAPHMAHPALNMFMLIADELCPFFMHVGGRNNWVQC